MGGGKPMRRVRSAPYQPSTSSTSMGGAGMQNESVAALMEGEESDGGEHPSDSMGEQQQQGSQRLEQKPQARPATTAGTTQAGAAEAENLDPTTPVLTGIGFIPPDAGTPAAAALAANAAISVSKYDKVVRRHVKRIKVKNLTRNLKSKKRRKKKGKRNFKGKVIDGLHELYTLTAGMMLGIRVAIGRQSPFDTQEVLLRDFMHVDKYIFPPLGNTAGRFSTPPHSLAHTFKFKNYAPKIFRRIRNLFGIDSANYMLSVCGNYNFLEFISNSKSGQFFFYSHDGRYMIKTQTPEENKFLRRILPHYYRYIVEHPNTLICRFFGMHRVKMYHLRRKVHFVIMSSVFDTFETIHTIYDLKGSSIGRRATPSERESGGVRKDLDLVEDGVVLQLGEKKRAFMQQVRKDADFLAKMNIMDYSLLLGLHDRGLRPMEQGRAQRSDTPFRRKSAAAAQTTIEAAAAAAAEHDRLARLANAPAALPAVHRRRHTTTAMVGAGARNAQGGPGGHGQGRVAGPQAAHGHQGHGLRKAASEDVHSRRRGDPSAAPSFDLRQSPNQGRKQYATGGGDGNGAKAGGGAGAGDDADAAAGGGRMRQVAQQQHQLETHAESENEQDSEEGDTFVDLANDTRSAAAVANMDAANAHARRATVHSAGRSNAINGHGDTHLRLSSGEAEVEDDGSGTVLVMQELSHKHAHHTGVHAHQNVKVSRIVAGSAGHGGRTFTGNRRLTTHDLQVVPEVSEMGSGRGTARSRGSSAGGKESEEEGDDADFDAADGAAGGLSSPDGEGHDGRARQRAGTGVSESSFADETVLTDTAEYLEDEEDSEWDSEEDELNEDDIAVDVTDGDPFFEGDVTATHERHSHSDVSASADAAGDLGGQLVATDGGGEPTATLGSGGQRKAVSFSRMSPAQVHEHMQMQVHEAAERAARKRTHRRTPWSSRRDQGIISRVPNCRDIYFVGIIDILQQYNTFKHAETIVKSLSYDSNEISSVDPQRYADRFVKFLDENTA